MIKQRMNEGQRIGKRTEQKETSISSLYNREMGNDCSQIMQGHEATNVRETYVLVVESKYTERQGQYLAYIHTYTKLHRRPPAEADIQFYFRVSPPTVHQMVLKLDEKGLIRRKPGQTRSIEVLVPPDELPRLI